MKIISTKNNSVVSHGIRSLSNSKASHVGFIVLDSFVIHSNFLGVRIEWKKTFLKQQTIVREIDYKMKSDEEFEWLSYVMNNKDETEYDFKAFVYFGYRLLLFRFFGKPIPLENKEGSGAGLLCVGLGAYLPMSIRGNLTEKRAEMLIPDKFMDMIQLNIDNGGK